MRAYLEDLLDRMCTKEEYVDSSTTVSWRATREAEKLTDLSMVDELVEYIGANPHKDRRGRAYFIIGKIGANLKNPDCARALLALAEKETDKYALSTLLDWLADVPKPAGTDLGPIFRLLDDKRWQVRHSAIRALENTDSPEAEERLLALLGGSTDQFVMTYCHATLNRIGTTRSIPILRLNTESRKRDVSGSAEAAIGAIEARFGLEPTVGQRAVRKRRSTPTKP